MSRNRREQEDRIRALRATVPLVAGCTDRQLRAIDALGTQVDVAPGRALTIEGAVGREVFVVLSGSAAARRGGVAVGTVEAGSVVGEMALLGGTIRSATVVATTAMRVLVLDSREFSDLLDAAPVLEPALLDLAADRRRALAGVAS